MRLAVPESTNFFFVPLYVQTSFLFVFCNRRRERILNKNKWWQSCSARKRIKIPIRENLSAFCQGSEHLRILSTTRDIRVCLVQLCAPERSSQSYVRTILKSLINRNESYIFLYIHPWLPPLVSTRSILMLQTRYVVFLSKSHSYFWATYGSTFYIVNMEVRGTIWWGPSDDAIHFYSSLNRETGFLSRNRPR